MFNYDATGVDASGNYPVIEDEKWLEFRISVATEGKSKDGDYQVVVDSECLNPQWRNFGVRHWVTFLPPGKPGSGMAIHFLKCIGEPHEGALNVDPLSWELKKFMARTFVNTHNGKRNNKFAEISRIEEKPGDTDDPFDVK